MLINFFAVVVPSWMDVPGVMELIGRERILPTFWTSCSSVHCGSPRGCLEIFLSLGHSKTAWVPYAHPALGLQLRLVPGCNGYCASGTN